MIASLRRWLIVRRLRRHHAWIKRNRVVFVAPRPDDRNWSDLYMKSYRNS